MIVGKTEQWCFYLCYIVEQNDKIDNIQSRPSYEKYKLALVHRWWIYIANSNDYIQKFYCAPYICRSFRRNIYETLLSDHHNYNVSFRQCKTITSIIRCKTKYIAWSKCSYISNFELRQPNYVRSQIGKVLLIPDRISRLLVLIQIFHLWYLKIVERKNCRSITIQKK